MPPPAKNSWIIASAPLLLLLLLLPRLPASASFPADALPGMLTVITPSPSSSLLPATANHNSRSTASPLFEVGSLNLSTGVVRVDSSFALPPAGDDDGCSWRGAPGAAGPSSTALFPINSTWFFLAQRVCNSNVTNGGVHVLTPSRGPEHGLHSEKGSEEVRETVLFGLTGLGRGGLEVVGNWSGGEYPARVELWNVAWDHVCNILVLAPRPAEEGTRVEEGADYVEWDTLMVSEYDGQVRPQTPLRRQLAGETNEPGWSGWALVESAPSFMDFHGKPTGGPYQSNCGEECSVYTLEEWWENGERALIARRLIGRNFHTAAVTYNRTDSLQIQTLSLDPALQFTTNGTDGKAVAVGLGVCCDHEWCEREVCGGHPGAMVLFAFLGEGDTHGAPLAPLALSVLNSGQPLPVASQADAIRLGVVLQRPGFEEPLAAHVLVNHRVESFTMSQDASSGKWQAALTATLSLIHI